MIEIIVLHCASEGVYGIDVVHQRIVLGRERFSLLKCGRSAGQRHSAMNAWQRRVLSWQHVCPRLRGHQPLHEPLEASSCSKPSRKSYCARRRCLKLLRRCLEGACGPFVDGPPVEMCESYATPGPAGCAGAAREGLLSRVGIRRADCCGWNYGRGAKVTALRRRFIGWCI